MSTQEIEQESLAEEEAVIEETVVEEVAEAAETAEPIEEEVIELEPIEPPQMWGKDYRELFEEWGNLENGRTYQEKMRDLYKEIQGHTTQKEQEAAEYRKQVEGWQEVIAPYQQAFQYAGQTPQTVVRQMLGLYSAFNDNPEQTLLTLARQKGLDLAQIGQEGPYVPPEVQSIQTELQQLKMAQAQYLQAEQQKHSQAVQQQIQTFASEQDESGNPKHPHFQALEETMARLIQGGAASDLEEAYDKACKLNPELEAQAKAEAARKEAARKAAAAKKAKQAAERPTGRQTGDDSKGKTLKEEIAENIRKSAA